MFICLRFFLLMYSCSDSLIYLISSWACNSDKTKSEIQNSIYVLEERTELNTNRKRRRSRKNQTNTVFNEKFLL